MKVINTCENKENPNDYCPSDPPTLAEIGTLKWDPKIVNFEYSHLTNEALVTAFFPHTPSGEAPGDRGIALFWVDRSGTETRLPYSCDLLIDHNFGTCPPTTIPYLSDAVSLRLRLTACGTIPTRVKKTEKTIPYPVPYLDYDDEPKMCGEDATAGAPVRLTNGNMRYEEALPLPSLISGDRLMTYDTENGRRGFFGTGWWSIFDAVVDNWGADGYRVITESNHSILFDSGGNQVFPVTGPLGSLEDLGKGGYRYTVPSGSVVRHFNNDGRLEKIEEPAQNTSLEIDWAGVLPDSVYDTNGRWTRSFTFYTPPDSNVVMIESIASSGTTLEFSYDNISSSDQYEQFRIGEISANTNLWRKYIYDDYGRLLEANDGTGAFIETHSYDPDTGYAISSSTATENITSIEYRVPPSEVYGRQPNLAEDEYVTRVTWAPFPGTDLERVVEYYIRPVRIPPEGDNLAPDRVYEVNGDCGCPGGGEFLSFARDNFGRVVRRQDASGYVTIYEHDASNRVRSVKHGYYPAGCDPISDPVLCRRSSDELADLAPEGLVASPQATAVEFSYDDVLPNRVASTCRNTVVPGSLFPEDACEIVDYSETGAIIERTSTGTIWDHDLGTADPEFEVRSEITTLYAELTTPVFDPTEFHDGIVFDYLAWEDDPQPEGLPKQIDGPLGNTPYADVTEFVYYPLSVDQGDPEPDPRLRGRLAAVKVPANDEQTPNAFLVTVYDDYDAFGNPTTIIDPRGVVTKYVYDHLGRLEETTLKGNCNPDLGFNQDPLCGQDLISTYTYHGSTNRVDLITQPGGAITSQVYEPTWGRLWKTLRGSSTATITEGIYRGIDGDSGAVLWEKTIQKAGGVWTTRRKTQYRYDNAGRVKTVIRPTSPTDPDPAVETYEYDHAGNLKFVTDPLHASANIEYLYDPLGRLAEVKQLAEADPDPERWIDTEYGYDAHGNLARLTDANGNVTEYAVDDFGQTYRIDSPVTGITQMSYDADGRLTSRKDARGAEETREYGLSGGPTQITFSLSPMTDDIVTYGYRHGFRVTATSGDVSEGWTYDRRGSILNYLRDGQSLLFEYNEDGALSKRKRGPYEVIDYVPDWAGRPSAVLYTAPFNGAPVQTIVSAMDWLPQGPISRVQRGSIIDEHHTFDLQYRMTGHIVNNGTGPLVDREYDYDNAGNLLGIDDLLDPTRDLDYMYDELGRLERAEGPFGPNSQIDYEYDDIGSRKRRDVYDTMPVYTRSEILESFDFEGSTPLITLYVKQLKFMSEIHDIFNDDSGSITQDVFAEYHYSPRGKMFERGSWGFDYDAAGLRARTVAPAPASTETLHYHGPDGEQLFEEERVSGVPSRAWTHIFAGDRLLAQVEHSYSAGQYTGSEVRHVESDHIAFPIMSLNNTGTVVWEARDVLPFGEIVTSVGTADPMLRYPGQWALRDFYSAPKLYSNGYRWYLPEWGRYSQSDPLGLWGSANLYLYAEANPTVNTDITGLTVDPGPHYRGTYKKLKDCSQFFSSFIGYFENSPVNYRIRNYENAPFGYDGGGCLFTFKNSWGGPTIWVPPQYTGEGTTNKQKCRSLTKCFVHEFFELYAIRRLGHSQSGAAGDAHRLADRLDDKVADCCCD